ncbi:trypsin-like serine protease [Photobacterium damselae]|uniref:trypsin-like serine protease n=1 Tax=Photobacterium damselae TaxID=38293 RepID=UPI004068DFC8
MNKLLLASLITLASTPALAIEGGKPLDWAKHDNLVRMNCTGTIIGGKFVLTANHCVENGQKLGAVVLANDVTATIKEYYRPNHGNEEDISIWELASTPYVTAFDPLSMMPVAVGDKLQISGFGEKQITPRTATREVDYISIMNTLYGTKPIGQGIIEGGDSGGPNFLHVSNLRYDGIVSITRSGIGGSDISNPSKHTRLDYPPARKLILDSVNGWHYPTAVKTTNGTANIPIQSLFAENQGTGKISLFNEIITEGDIDYSIDPECKSYEPKEGLHIATPSDIKPFDLCTIRVTAADNSYGVLTVRNTAGNGRDAIITINPQAKPKPQPDNGGNSQNGENSQPTNNGGSGGSTGILTLIGLLGIALKRKFF